MLGGLWEFPGGKVEPGETLPQALRREVREEVDIDVEIGQKLCLVRHAYSHFRITLHAFGCRLIAGQARAVACDAVRWVKPDRLRRYAFPRANQKVLDVLAD
jgi:A/G-specific adenine glycosylase